MPHLTQEMSVCIDECIDCSKVCTETIAHCLEMGGKHAEHKHISLLQLCAQICHVSANAMLSGSELHTETCGACAAICDACAESCSALGGTEMERCAEACRSCVDSCKAMSGGRVGRAA